VLISAPSGAGKTTVCQRLLASRPSIVRAVTTTTRPPRAGEENGIDYHFLSRDVFEDGVRAGEFLEHATVHGNLYGVRHADLADALRAGNDVLLNVDVQGASTLRAKAATNADLRRALVTIFLAPPSLAVLRNRLCGRGTDSVDVIERRLAAAQSELAHWNRFDYLVVSGTVDEDLRRMQVILEAEKLRQPRCAPPNGA
jgi:guanylate kinase